MPHLQLAEGFTRYLAEDPKDLYVFVPSNYDGTEGQFVREDYFDNLSPQEWEMVMAELADYQPQQMNGIFSNIRENIAARRERRDERKEAKQQASIERIESRSEGLFGGKLRNFVGSLIPGAPAAAQTPIQQPIRGMMPNSRAFDLDFSTQPPSFFEQNKGWLIPVGLGAAGLGIYFLTKKKK